MNKETRAGNLGRLIGEVLIEIGHLFYNNRTACNFLEQIMIALQKEFQRRKYLLKKKV